MNVTQIDAAIRERLLELRAVNFVTNEEASAEYYSLVGNHLPSVATPLLWDDVVEFSADVCNPGSSTDGSPGRLYALSDAEIIEAEKWFHANKDWRGFMPGLLEESTPQWAPGLAVKIGGREIPVAVMDYVTAAFPM